LLSLVLLAPSKQLKVLVMPGIGCFSLVSKMMLTSTFSVMMVVVTEVAGGVG
jgi:hypothetical protein